MNDILLVEELESIILGGTSSNSKISTPNGAN